MSDVRDEIIDLFKKRIFLYNDKIFKVKEKEELDENKFFKNIDNKSGSINYDLFKKYFNFKIPSALAKKLFKTKNKTRSNELVELIRARWSNLQD